MKPSKRGRGLLVAAGAAALIAGFVTGTQLTLEDEAWPARGGIKGLLQTCALFTAYAFAVALAVGALLAATLSPLIARAGGAGPWTHLLAGLGLGLAVHLLVAAAIGERIDSSEDWLGGTLAGGAAGPLWWFLVQRHLKKASANG
ncbi:MAG TPA: hypothetical protein VK403_09180 [Allosphingosinicella sp.]|nr:hypothetical protein [Allosphingosinicella sp.]